MRVLPVGRTRTGFFGKLGDLPQVVLCMSAMKLAPFLSAQRSQRGMVQEFGAAPEAPLRVVEGRIKRYQRIVEAGQRLFAPATFRNRLRRGQTSHRHQSQLCHANCS